MPMTSIEMLDQLAVLSTIIFTASGATSHLKSVKIKHFTTEGIREIASGDLR